VDLRLYSFFKWYLKKNRGSMTIEAALIVPVIIISLILLVYICIFMYQQAYIKSLSNTAAERGAAVWANPSKDLYVEFVDREGLSNTPLYWRVGELFSSKNKQNKYDKVNKFITGSISKYSVFDKNKGPMTLKYTDSNMNVKCELTDYVIYKKFKVSIEEEYNLPISNVLNSFGFNVEFKISASSESVVSDPVEFVRNTDFVIDSVREIDQKTGGKLEGMVDKITDTFDKLSGKLKSFLE